MEKLGWELEAGQGQERVREHDGVEGERKGYVSVAAAAAAAKDWSAHERVHVCACVRVRACMRVVRMHA